jgi:hypothetical protein
MYFLKLGLLFFWAAWFSIVTITNACSALKASGVLGPSWRFASKNYPMVVKAVSIYDSPPWLPKLLFMGVVAWQTLAAIFFWYALAASGAAGFIDLAAANLALGTGILLWGAFMIADEITIKYAMEQPHELLFIAQVGTLLVMHLI